MRKPPRLFKKQINQQPTHDEHVEQGKQVLHRVLKLSDQRASSLEEVFDLLHGRLLLHHRHLKGVVGFDDLFACS